MPRGINGDNRMTVRVEPARQEHELFLQGSKVVAIYSLS